MMSPCLRPEEVMDLVDGTLDVDRRRHLDDCSSCRAAAASVRETLALVSEDEVPEPSVLFWPRINARVAAAIVAPRVPAWRRWLGWSVAAPVAGLAVLALVVASTWSPSTPSDPGRNATLTTSPPAEPIEDDAADAVGESDSALALVIDLTRGLPDGGWDSLGLSSLPDLAVAAAVLTPDEQDALAEILRTAVERPTS
jgi:hypothetical protein